ncbi:hypothetical protein IW256_004429 [Actinomadura viridis]|uniref:Uncharacterized protein n=1 Tax=Actinomadura viridis TaxID=58110 RepID=A0A931DMG7_9ACTN|nr:hypothetical protein [Actinomadura viridis]
MRTAGPARVAGGALSRGFPASARFRGLSREVRSCQAGIAALSRQAASQVR